MAKVARMRLRGTKVEAERGALAEGRPSGKTAGHLAFLTPTLGSNAKGSPRQPEAWRDESRTSSCLPLGLLAAQTAFQPFARNSLPAQGPLTGALLEAGGGVDNDVQEAVEPGGLVI